MASKTPIEIEQQIIKLYNDGIGTSELAKRFNIHRTTIQRILQRNNITLRKSSPRTNKYNIHFFDEYTPESCYWAGFIAADGNVRSDRNCVSIHLKITDKKHLEKFAKLIDFTGIIEQDTTSCRISINGEWYVKKLEEKYNIIPQKTLVLEPPVQIPKDLLPHYIRGYFDGDGCVTQTNNYPHISFTSGSKKMLQFFIDYFYNNNIIIRNNKKNNTGKPQIQSRHIDYFCDNALKILELLYKDSDINIRLDRKYNKYLDFSQARDYINNFLPNYVEQ